VTNAGYACYDCQHHGGAYMVHDHVWDAAWPDYWKVKRSRAHLPERRDRILCLCLGCLSRRLGRPLTPDDFDLEVPLNESVRVGIEMGERTKGAPRPLEP